MSINGEGWDVPPFLIVQGVNHLANWYSETDLPHNWVIKPTSNGWTNNETGLEWLKHFDKHTSSQAKGSYRMLVLDGHESYESIEFQDYCKCHNIITLGLPPHSSHLTQPLDIGCFSVLKRAYGRQIEVLMKAHINHVTKVEFFMTFKVAYLWSITIQNAQAGFREAGLIPFDPQAVISNNPTDALSQTTLVKGRIARYQGSSPTSIFATVIALAKGTERLAHEVKSPPHHLDHPPILDHPAFFHYFTNNT